MALLPNIPPQSERATDNRSIFTQPWYTWLYSLWQKIRPLWFLRDKFVYVDENGNIVGRDVDTSEFVFPEAPLDGRQYGRQMAQWTVIQQSTGGGGAPGAPDFSVQYRIDATTFGGTGKVLSDGTDLTFQPTGFIYGEWSDSTLSNRVFFKPSEPDGDMFLSIMPNGSSTKGCIDLYSNEDLTATSPSTLRLRTELDQQAGSGGGWCYFTLDKVAGSDALPPIAFRFGSNGVLSMFNTGQVRISNAVAPFSSYTGLVADGTCYFASAVTMASTLTLTLDGIRLPASASGVSPLRIPHGIDPVSTLTDGDIWTTSAAVKARINGETVSLLDSTTLTSGAEQIPYFVPSGQTVTLGEYKQATFFLPIDIEGTFEVLGYLTEITV